MTTDTVTLDWLFERLEPELHEYVDVGPFGPMLKHPLCYTHLLTLLDARLPTPLDIIKQKRDSIREAVAKARWHAVLWLHERAYRCQALHKLWIEHALHPGIVGPLCADVWVDSENIGECLPFWADFYREVPAECWMSHDDRNVWAALPEEITVYRGVCHDGGYSWTLNEDTAKWFAQRGLNDSTGEVIEKTVPKAETFAYLGGRGEDEVLIIP